MAKKNYFFQRNQIGSLFKEEGARSLAAGVALGVLIGLIPKESMLVPCLVMVLILSPASLLSGSIASGVFFLISQIHGMQMIAVTLGITLLQWSILEPFWQFFLKSPFLPWFCFDSPLTIGWSLIGIFTALLCYFGTDWWLQRRMVSSSSPGQRTISGEPVGQVAIEQRNLQMNEVQG